MSDQDIFDKAEPAAKPVDAPAANPLDDLLKGIVNEQGQPKYKSVEDALKSVPHKEQHISKLEQELAEVRAELAKRATVEEVVAKVVANKPTDTPAGTVDLAAIEQIMERKAFEALSTMQQQQVAKANRVAVSKALAEKFGSEDKAAEALAQKANELGLPPQELGRMASYSPRAVLAYFEAASPAIPAKPAGTVAPPTSTPTPAKQFSMLAPGSTKDVLAEFRRHKPQ